MSRQCGRKEQLEVAGIKNGNKSPYSEGIYVARLQRAADAHVTIDAARLVGVTCQVSKPGELLIDPEMNQRIVVRKGFIGTRLIIHHPEDPELLQIASNTLMMASEEAKFGK